MTVDRLVSWVEHGAFPPPSFIDNNGVRYFDQEWIRKAREIVESKKGVRDEVEDNLCLTTN
jgi:hypothetical protein